MAQKSKVRGPRRYGRKLPPVGTVLSHEFRRRGGKRAVAKVVKAPGFPDERAVELEGKLYRSMTAAAQSLTLVSTNGWLFWKW